MIDMIRNSQVQSNMMQFAARGALAVPPEETIEILVYLALHNKRFGEQARLTLAGWDEKSSIAAAGNPQSSSEVLKYLVSKDNLRISLLPALANNPAVEEEDLDDLAASGSRGVVEGLLLSSRVMSSRRLLEALQSNVRLRANELAEVAKKLSGEGASQEAGSQAGDSEPEAAAIERENVEPHGRDLQVDDLHVSDLNASPKAEVVDEAIEGTVTKYFEDNAAELAAEKEKPFQPLGLSHEEGAPAEDANGEAVDTPPAVAAAEPASSPPASVIPVTDKKPVATMPKPKVAALSPQELRRDSPLQKIAKLDIRGRISLAMRGNKEDRSILVRDSTKLVAIAVLESPKITDGEVEAFALQKNVLESVLRAIPMKRRFAKNYNIMRNLVQNPRTPLDLSLGLMKNLLVRDLKNLSGNKEVADTIRKVALRMYKQKMEKKD